MWPPSFCINLVSVKDYLNLFPLEIGSINCKIQQKIIKEHEQDNKRPVCSENKYSDDDADGSGEETGTEHLRLVVSFQALTELHGEHWYFADKQSRQYDCNERDEIPCPAK